LVDSFGSFSLFWPKRCPNTKHCSHKFKSNFLVIILF
jgi:hypothetical protein